MSGVAAPPGSPAPGPAHGGSLAPDTQTWPVSRVSLPHRRLGSTRCLPGTAAAAGGGSARLPGSPGWISVTCLACPHPTSPELLSLVPGGPAPAARRHSPGSVPLPQVPGAVPACQVGAASQVLVSFWKLQGAGGGGLPREPGLSSAEVSSGSSVALGQAHLSEDAST